MQTGNVLLVILAALLIGVGVPTILLGMRRSGMQGQLSFFRRLSGAARNPWKAEDDKLKELAERVRKLRPEEDNQP